MLIVDAHEDLAWNMLALGRDYTRSAAETRRLEAAAGTGDYNGDTLLGYAEYQRGQVALVFGTLFAAPQRLTEDSWDTQVYTDVAQANRLYRSQLGAYQRLVEEHPDQFRLVLGRDSLQGVLAPWKTDNEQDSQDKPVGIVVLMEGAEGVQSPGELEDWWQQGVRLIGLAWAGNRFCGGTREPGPLTRAGFALLEGMADIGFILDLSHMDEQAALQALDAYPGAIVATHANAKSLLPGTDSNRHLTDRLIQGLIERDGVVGVVPYNAFLQAGWRKGDPRQAISLERVVAQIDWICQLAGDARHAGLGTDFDGGFGVQSVPAGIDTIADLQQLAPLLAAKGYSSLDIAAILGQNWLDRLEQHLPAGL